MPSTLALRSMRLSHESQKVRWLVLVATWLILSFLIGLHTKAIGDYLTIAESVGLRGAPVAGTPMATVFPSFAADAQTWVRHALALLEGDSLRLRATTIDNAPFGREVHWNSAWAWTLAFGGWMEHWVTGVPVNLGVERAALWLPPITMLVLMMVISSWAARWTGALGGVLVACALVGNPRLAEGFFPKYFDHHGLLSYAALGVVLGMTIAAGGWRRQRKDEEQDEISSSPAALRAGVIFSAVCGAVGLWISAASIIPPIGAVGAAGLLVAFVCGRSARATGWEFDPELWRLWGRVGGGLAFGFYLLEYFPSHLSMRLEPNHPVYAMAWLGGGELIALLGARACGREPWKLFPVRRAALAFAAVGLAPLTILILGQRSFVVMDPFMSRLHNDYIQEFLPLWRSLFGSGWRGLYSILVLDMLPIFIGLGLIVRYGRKLAVTVWFSLAISFSLMLLAWLQSRWLLNASGAAACTALVVAAYFCSRVPTWLRWLAVVGFCTWVYGVPAGERAWIARSDVANRRVSPREAHFALARDIAGAIRSSQPTGAITLLSSPNSSTSIGYYGRFKTLGTLYWENHQGLKNAADIYAAPNELAAAGLIKKLGVTHLALITEENFILQYFLLRNPGAPVEHAKASFGHQLFFDRKIPTWLRMIPYKVPDDLAALNQTVMLFQVDFNQSPADALYHLAMAKVVSGALVDAEQDFLTLTRQSAPSYQPWLRLGELAFLRQDGAAALKYTIEGVNRAPAAERRNIVADNAVKFYRASFPQGAAALYRLGLTFGFDPEPASALAYILATNKDDTLRNGEEALKLAEAAVKLNPNSIIALSALAAAQAELGRFGEAVATTERALANSRVEGNQQAQSVSVERLALFRAGKPLRE